MSANCESLRIDGHEVKIIRPEKILFPEDGLRRRDLVDYCSKDLRSDGVTIRIVFKRLEKVSDPSASAVRNGNRRSTMPLEEYRKKRNFAETPEPAGRTRRGRHKHILVVQKHDASRLHYDFRLEIGGVLVSWAIPKGPSMNPAEKRLAIRTEDHPLEYAEFEGVIPEGEYGAGTVMVWDRGTYQSKDGLSPDLQLARGKIDFVLQGRKLLGGFAVVRTETRRRQEQWLLIKERDAYADPSWDIESPEFDRSVLTGRKLKEIEVGAPREKSRRTLAHF